MDFEPCVGRIGPEDDEPDQRQPADETAVISLTALRKEAERLKNEINRLLGARLALLEVIDQATAPPGRADDKDDDAA